MVTIKSVNFETNEVCFKFPAHMNTLAQVEKALMTIFSNAQSGNLNQTASAQAVQQAVEKPPVVETPMLQKSAQPAPTFNLSSAPVQAAETPKETAPTFNLDSYKPTAPVPVVQSGVTHQMMLEAMQNFVKPSMPAASERNQTLQRILAEQFKKPVKEFNDEERKALHGWLVNNS